MTPVHSTSGGKRYRYYISRFAAGEAKVEPWRVPAGEIERLVIDALSEWFRNGAAGTRDGEAAELEAERDYNDGLAASLPTMNKHEQRKTLLGLRIRITLAADALELRLGRPDAAEDVPSPALRIPTTMVRRGMDLKLSFAPNASCSTSRPDPVLLKLLAQAAAAQRLAVDGGDAPTVSEYGKRHLWQLLRISWLAPDILSAIVEGRQPADLTGRRLLRATDIPLDWAEQRRMFGFA